MNIQEKFDLREKIALVTGASRGLGRGYARALAGCLVFLASAASNYVTGQIFYVDGGWLAS